MTLLERAARAMYDNVKPDWDWDDPDAELLRTMYRENARAAITAIREPSERAEGWGWEDVPGLYVEYGINQDGPEKTWRAMIDAMLEEG